MRRVSAVGVALSPTPNSTCVRYISGFFYRAHSPNWDRFGLRPGYFSKDPTYPFKFSFEDYLPMPEYHNILVKMFALDRFP